MKHAVRTTLLLPLLPLALVACSPTVRVMAPQKPITINLNVKVQQEIRVKVAKDVDELFKEKKGIF